MVGMADEPAVLETQRYLGSETMVVTSKDHKRCRKQSFDRVQRILHPLHLLSVTDCPESGVPEQMNRIIHAGAILEAVRRNLRDKRVTA
jgi:hypothetical protein